MKGDFLECFPALRRLHEFLQERETYSQVHLPAFLQHCWNEEIVEGTLLKDGHLHWLFRFHVLIPTADGPTDWIARFAVPVDRSVRILWIT